MPRGYLQLEGGYVFAHDDGDSTHSAPLLVLRAGVRDDVELRFGWTGLVASDAGDGDTEVDAGDVTLGAKVTVYDPEDAPLTVGVLGQVSLPVGGGNATSDSVDPSLALLWAYDVPGPTALFGNLVVSSLTDDDDDRLIQGGASVGLGFPIVTRLAGYVEYFGLVADDADGAAHNLNGGLLYLVTDNLQLDLFGQLGLNDEAGDYALGGGFGVRF